MNSLDAIKEKSKESIARTLRRFALITCASSVVSAVVYALLGLYYPSLIVSIIGVLFLWIVYLNYKSYHSFARLMSILAANLGIFLFSIYLGFKAGFYLYIFSAPQITFLLFHIKQKKWIYLCLAIMLLTFIGIYTVDYFHLTNENHLSEKHARLIYGINFFSSLAFGFFMVKAFAKNNESYIDMLKETNIELEVQKESLKNEIELKNATNEQLQKTIKDKEILLAEVHHRVKNNLAIVSGLLDLQNVFVKDKMVQDALKDSKNRIKSIALLHEMLYVHPNLDKVNIKEYLNKLVGFIQLAHRSENKNVQIEIKVEDLELSMEAALPFSLLVNELITNSYKHAFPSQEKGRIFVALNQQNDDLKLDYQDDGVGFDISTIQNFNSIGSNLIDAFAIQLGGRMVNQTKPNGGCHMILTFKDV